MSQRQTLSSDPLDQNPVNTKHLYNICTKLNQRWRCWADVGRRCTFFYLESSCVSHRASYLPCITACILNVHDARRSHDFCLLYIFVFGSELSAYYDVGNCNPKRHFQLQMTKNISMSIRHHPNWIIWLALRALQESSVNLLLSDYIYWGQFVVCLWQTILSARTPVNTD